MIIHDVKQGDPEWLTLRMGIPTASSFEKIMTPKGTKDRKKSSQQERYMNELIAERIMGHPIHDHISMWMHHGTEKEADAVRTYMFTREVETYPIGFISNDSLTWGASPDRGIADEGLLEIKSPSEAIHVSYLRKAGSHYEDYKLQCQGQLWISGRQWLDIMSYSEDMPDALIRVERDEECIAALKELVGEFSVKLEREYASMVADGLAPEKWRKAA